MVIRRIEHSIPDLSACFSQGVHELLEGLAFELTDALAGQAQVLADLAQGHGVVAVEPKPHANHGGLAILERSHVLEDAIEVIGLD